jgi:hypothetical protein
LTKKEKEESKRAKEFAMRRLERWERQHGSSSDSIFLFDKDVRQRIRRGEHLK